jgi:hypothetical protein
MTMSIFSTTPTFIRIGVNILFMRMIIWVDPRYMREKNVHNVEDWEIGTNSQCKPWCNVNIQQTACKIQSVSEVSIRGEKKMEKACEKVQKHKPKDSHLFKSTILLITLFAQKKMDVHHIQGHWVHYEQIINKILTNNSLWNIK